MGLRGVLWRYDIFMTLEGMRSNLYKIWIGIRDGLYAYVL